MTDQRSQPTSEPVRQHSPLPWKEHAGYIYSPGENGANVCAMSEPRASTEVGYTQPLLGSEASEEIWANADLIVTACNSHASLKARVEELEAALEEIIKIDQGERHVLVEADPAGNTYEVTAFDGPRAEIARRILGAARTEQERGK